MALVKPIINLKNIRGQQYDTLRTMRWKARTDLGWLCREILNFPDIDGREFKGFHTPVINNLQHFPAPTRQQFEENDRIDGGEWVYKPILPMLELKGSRRNLILDPRSHLKTTLNSVAHSIQWIINYPEIAILILMSSDTKAEDVLKGIKDHFKYNPKFRELFPEHCPTRSINDWGSAGRFTSEARPKHVIRKEPTLLTGSVEKGAAGYHFDVIKFSDIVDENNISGNGLVMVRDKFDISINLLVSPKYWMDVEGTRYHFADVYGKIIEREQKRADEGLPRNYNIHTRGVYKRNVPGGEKFVPGEEKYPYLLDAAGKKQPRVPERFPLEALEDEQNNNHWLFSCQKENAPASNIPGSSPFPVDSKFPVKISREVYTQNIRIAYKEITVDFAETANRRSNYTVITVGAVDDYGRIYIEEIIHGKFLPDFAIQKMFEVAIKHLRHLKSIKIEKSSFLRGLMSSINRILDTQLRPKGIDITIEQIARAPKISKQDRIYRSLQPFYKSETLRFLDDIEPNAWRHLIQELEQFPSSETDDILDTLADFLTGKEYFGRENGRGGPTPLHRNEAGLIQDPNRVNAVFKQVQRHAFDKWLDIAPIQPFGDSTTPTELDPNDWHTKLGVY